jgi:hypothetical protein
MQRFFDRLVVLIDHSFVDALSANIVGRNKSTGMTEGAPRAEGQDAPSSRTGSD